MKKNFQKNKIWLLIGFIIIILLTLGSYKFLNRTKDLLVSTEWVSKQQDSDIIMHYVFSDNQYSLIPEDVSGNKLSQDIINEMGITVDIKYGKLKSTISYAFDNSSFTFDVKKEGKKVVLENQHNKQKNTLTPLKIYNDEVDKKISKESKDEYKDLVHSLKQTSENFIEIKENNITNEQLANLKDDDALLTQNKKQNLLYFDIPDTIENLDFEKVPHLSNRANAKVNLKGFINDLQSAEKGLLFYNQDKPNKKENLSNGEKANIDAFKKNINDLSISYDTYCKENEKNTDVLNLKNTLKSLQKEIAVYKID